MDTNINQKDGDYTSDTIKYDDSQISTILTELNSIKALLDEVGSEVNSISKQEHNWHGESKKEYLELKGFMKKYKNAYKKSIDELHSTIAKLDTLLHNIDDSHVIQEIRSASGD